MDSGDSVVGLNGDGGGESSWLVGGVAGVAGHGTGVAEAVEVALLVTEGVGHGSGVVVGVEGAVEQLGVGLSLSSSQGSAKDLSIGRE